MSSGPCGRGRIRSRHGVEAGVVNEPVVLAEVTADADDGGGLVGLGQLVVHALTLHTISCHLVCFSTFERKIENCLVIFENLTLNVMWKDHNYSSI